MSTNHKNLSKKPKKIIKNPKKFTYIWEDRMIAQRIKNGKQMH